MEHRDLNEERWVDECLRTLDPEAGWTPDAARARTRLRGKQRRRSNIQRASFCAMAAAIVSSLTLVAIPAPARCAMTGLGCARESVPVRPAAAINLPNIAGPKAAVEAAPTSPLSKPIVVPKKVVYRSYKQQGSPSAPVVCEIYSDYECPACAAFYRDVFPRLESQYVSTGKLRVIHRDFPLPMHPYSVQAARYADAAGELGYYEPVFRQLFAKQKEWSASGNLDPIVGAIVPPEKMIELLKRLANDAALDSSLAADMEMVRRDEITQTPTLVFVVNGARTKVAGNPPFTVLAQFLDETLKR